MKKVLLALTLLSLLLCACGEKRLSQSQNGESNEIIGGADGPTSIIVGNSEDILKEIATQEYQGDGYVINIPAEGFRYEKEFDDGVLEETWESTENDHAELKVSTYKNTSSETAQAAFLKEHDDFIFEDLMGSPLCGFEADGNDVLWFHLHEKNENVYIVSWEYSALASDNSSKILAALANTFRAE